jgi:ABC-2 type transport system permease protein
MTVALTEGGPSGLAQSWALAQRAIIRYVRQPAAWIPGLLFPLMLLAVNSSALGGVSQIPGVLPPGTTFLMFLLPATILQGVLIGGMSSGSEMARDIQTGFLDRLTSSPMARPAILIGRLGGAMAFGAFLSVAFQLLAWPFGGDVVGGVAGRLVLVATAVLLSLAVGALGVGIAARTGQEEAVQGFFPLIFISLFLSSCFFPLELMTGWYKTVASYNPLSLMVDGMRHQVLVGFSLSEAAVAIAVAAALAVLGLVFASMQLRRRIRTAS